MRSTEQNERIMRSRFLLPILFFLFIPSMAFSATYYMPDDFANLQAAMAGMSGGDELIIRDGTYTGTNNMIDDAHVPPSGTATAYTTIRAEHPGEVIFDGENALNMFYVSNADRGYIVFRGIIWGRSNDNNCAYFDDWDHIKFQQCGFYDAGVNASTSYTGLYIRRGDYILIEDCYVWGEFFYGITFLECSHSIMRRCVARMDIKRSPDDRAGNFTTYSSTDIEIQNCIAIDGDSTAHYSPADGGYAFYNTNTNGGAARVHHTGNIALNIEYHSGYVMYSCVDFTFDNIVTWDTLMGFYDRIDTGTNVSTYDKCLFGRNHPSTGWGAIIGAHKIRNSIMVDNSTWGWEYGTPDLDYNVFYNNNPNYRDAAKRGPHDYCSENGNEINPYINGLLYLTRIESGSMLETAGEGGGRIGPDITKQIGVSGTLYGETGYKTVTSTSLWPFPHEDIIRAKMRTYNRNGVNGTRGFCADGQTLTKYIWEYLGNPIPDEIYGASGPASTDDEPPVISDVAATPSTTSATVSWATNEAANARVDYGTSTSYGQQVSRSTLATSHRLTLAGLQAGTLYHYRIVCSDSSGNTTQSGDYTLSTAEEPPAGGVTFSTLQNFEDGLLWVPGGPQDQTGNGRGWAFLDAGSAARIEIDETIGANGTGKSLKVTFDSDNPQIYFRSNDKITDRMPEAAGANRISFYVRFPDNFPIQTLPFRYDTWQFGTYIHDPNDWADTHQATSEDDHGIHHYYHRVTIEQVGNGWVKYIFTTQPDQANYSGSTVPPNIPHYFDSFGRFYFHFGPEAGGPDPGRPFTIWIDEIKFYHDDGSVGGQIHVGGQDDAGFDGEFFPDAVDGILQPPSNLRVNEN